MIDREKVIATAIEQLDWYFNEDDGGAADSFMDYCPHCGAKMDAEPPKEDA